MKKGRWILALPLAALLFLDSCSVPLTTARDEWDIHYDEAMIKNKEAFLAQAERSPGNPHKRPNIVLIVADDLGKYEVSAYGSTTIQTPHIDALGTEGIRFADCYVSSPVCSPSRAGFLTGRHQGRFGFETQPMEYYPNNLAVYWLGKNATNTGHMVVATPPRYPAEWQLERQGLPPSEINLAELLKTQGYRTACIGKWHLGTSDELVPQARGFDYQYGCYGAFTLYGKRNDPDIVSYVQPIFSSRYQWKHGRRTSSAIRRNGRVVNEKEYLTFALRDEAIRFMDEQVESRQPFFLYLSFTAPHVPFQAPRNYYDRYAHIEDENKRVYYAMISALDDAIGAIHQRIRELGIEEETIIYFLSDNGGASYTGATENGPYRGGKLTMFEGGVNVPFLMKWKGKLPNGMVFETPVSALDIFTTTAAAAGCRLPNDRVYDGIDLLPLLTGEASQPPQRAFRWKAGHIEAMRQGDWKFIRSKRDGWARLYHIGADRYEDDDLKDEKPIMLENMLRDYRKWEQPLPAPLWPRLVDQLFVIDGYKYYFPA